MPLEDILQEVEKRKEQEIKSISEEYKSKIDSVNSDLQKEIGHIESYYSKKTEDDTRALRDRELELARMEAKNLAREKVSKLMNKAFERADFFLRNISETKEYSRILKKMISLSTETLGADCVIHARKEDISFLQDMNKIKIAKANISVPGIIAESSDGSKELNLTISTIMEDLKEKISLELIKHLGEE